LLLVLLAQPALAAVTRYWVGPNPNNLWTNASNWSPAGVPVAGDVASLTQSDAINRTVWYNNPLNPLLTSVIVDATGTGAITLQQPGFNLAAAYEYIGFAGTGSFTQAGGNNKVKYALWLGYTGSGNGTYKLQTGNLETENDEYVGYSGTGSFTQTGGNHLVTKKLTLALNPGSSGTYNLQGGNLKVGTDEVIGYSGTGTFTQSSSNHTVTKKLTLALNPGSSGTYNLQNGNLSAYDEIVGNGGTGTFTQTFGGNLVTKGLTLALNPDSKGTYYLISGYLIAETENIGGGGAGTFTHSDGTNMVNSLLSLGAATTGSGTYNLKGDSNLWAKFEFIGDRGLGIFNQSGSSSHTVSSPLYLGRYPTGNGSYNLHDGFLYTSSPLIGFQGTGIFNQFDGDHIVSSQLVLGIWPTGSGTYNLMSGTGTLQANKEYIGWDGTGIFNQLGGTNQVTNLSLGFSTGNGTYSMTNGTLKAGREDIGSSGTGVFNQGGGQNMTNTLTLALNPGSKGTYNLEGGTLTANEIKINSGGTFNVKNVVTVNGNVVNDGKVKTTDATVTWNGSFVNNGVYASDPSTQTFAKDLVVGPSGYLVGHSQDLFIVRNDFKNQSTQKDVWDTVQSALQFATGADKNHLLYVPGVDWGKDPNGYIKNFAWGALIVTGQIVTLLDGNTDSGGALYVGGIIGAEPLYTQGKVHNIFGGAAQALNIYYDPDWPANAYLDRRTYSWMAGKGQLIPYHTPVPASVLLLGSGLLGLGLLGWRRKRS
jgi:hypothetical protein